MSTSDLGEMTGLSPAPDGWREEDDEGAVAASLELGLELELEQELEDVDADLCFLDVGGLVAGEPPPEPPPPPLPPLPLPPLPPPLEADWRASWPTSDGYALERAKRPFCAL